jgi:hypothetical protein
VDSLKQRKGILAAIFYDDIVGHCRFSLLAPLQSTKTKCFLLLDQLLAFSVVFSKAQRLKTCSRTEWNVWECFK